MDIKEVILCKFGSLSVSYVKKESVLCELFSIDVETVYEFGTEEHN